MCSIEKNAVFTQIKFQIGDRKDAYITNWLIQQSKSPFGFDSLPHNSDSVLADNLDGEGRLANHESVSHRVEALLNGLESFLLSKIVALEGVHDR